VSKENQISSAHTKHLGICFLNNNQPCFHRDFTEARKPNFYLDAENLPQFWVNVRNTPRNHSDKQKLLRAHQRNKSCPLPQRSRCTNTSRPLRITSMKFGDCHSMFKSRTFTLVFVYVNVQNFTFLQLNILLLE